MTEFMIVYLSLSRMFLLGTSENVRRSVVRERDYSWFRMQARVVTSFFLVSPVTSLKVTRSYQNTVDKYKVTTAVRAMGVFPVS